MSCMHLMTAAWLLLLSLKTQFQFPLGHNCELARIQLQ